ncbi:MAG: hypothetical protein ABH817_02455 [archaeon]
MEELFNQKIICSECKREMIKIAILKNGFKIRTLQCPKCKKNIYHPADIEEYKKFLILRKRPFSVKLRIVGNSYAVSIPKEIISFIHEQEKVHNEMIKMYMDEFGKLSLIFKKNADNN